MADPDPNPSVKGLERLRETAKWLIGAYAAVGAAIIAGLQLTSLGKVEDDKRLWIGAIAAGLALAAVVVGISKVAAVLAPVEVETKDLGPDSRAAREAGQTSVLLRGQATSLADLQAKYGTTVTDFEAKRAAAAGPFQNDEEQVAAEAEAARARKRVMALYEPLEETRKRVLFNKVEARYESAKKALGIAAAVTIAGTIVFAWAANPSEQSQAQAKAEEHGPTLEAPSQVVVSVSKVRPSLAPLRKRLGSHCTLREVAAVIVGGTSSAPEVVTLPERGCKVQRFTASEDIGVVMTGVPAG